MEREKQESRSTWGTKSELKWLEDLGKQKHSIFVFTPRKILLKKYGDSIKRRVNWGEIDKSKIEEYLNNAR